MLIKGYLFSYEPIDIKARTSLNRNLTGRLVYVDRRGKKVTYYVPGLLHEEKFKRINDGEVFILNNIFDDTELGMKRKDLMCSYGIINNEIVELNILESELKTGKEYWQEVSEKKGYKMIEQKKKRCLF